MQKIQTNTTNEYKHEIEVLSQKQVAHADPYFVTLYGRMYGKGKDFLQTPDF